MKLVRFLQPLFLESQTVVVASGALPYLLSANFDLLRAAPPLATRHFFP